MKTNYKGVPTHKYTSDCLRDITIRTSSGWGPGVPLYDANGEPYTDLICDESGTIIGIAAPLRPSSGG